MEEQQIEILDIATTIQKFNNYIYENMLSKKLISARLGVNYVYFSQMLRNKKPFSGKMRKKMNELLKTDF